MNAVTSPTFLTTWGQSSFFLQMLIQNLWLNWELEAGRVLEHYWQLLLLLIQFYSVLILTDCEQKNIPFRDRWHFVKANDIEFAKSDFKSWCLAHSIEPEIDVLFIDTSHEYQHTKKEIEIWSKHLSDKGIMIFHDTNMGKGMYTRNDGSMGFGWDNERGVMRAIEEFVDRQYDENSFFCDVTDKYSLIHFPNSNGLTIIKKRKGEDDSQFLNQGRLQAT